MEKWIKIKEIPKDGYFVSDSGLIKRVYKNGKVVIKTGSIDAYGYCVFSYAFKKSPLGVHRVVMNNHTIKPDWAQAINHKNGIKTDNRLENLEWCTYSQNAEHAYRTGLRGSGELHRNAMPRDIVHKVYEMKMQGKRQSEIAKELNLRRSKVSVLYRGIDWKYEYKKFFP